MKPFKPENHTPWEEFYRANVGQLETGACFEFATRYRNVRDVVPRHSH
jgi:dihydroxy-acid dehydratase